MSGVRPSRRAVLRGVGAALALPWLEGLVPSTARAATTSPQRLVVVLAPNGMPMDHWTPEGTGAAWTPSRLLAPLEGLRDHLTVISGLANAPVRGFAQHPAYAATMLTGAGANPAEAPPDGFVSMDQLAAQALGGATRFPSLELTSEGEFVCSTADVVGGEFSCAYHWTVSWSDARTPLPRERVPRRLFNRLFRAGSELGGRRASRPTHRLGVVDVVLEQAASLDKRLGRDDRQRLDQYLTQIHELERRLDLEEDGLPTCDGAEALDAALVTGPVDVTTYADQMAELLTLALRCDQTRVATWMMGNIQSERLYPHLGFGLGHHTQSHYGDDADLKEAVTRIGEWEVELFARLLGRMQAVDEGDGTLLDHAGVLFASPMGNPSQHDPTNLPVVLAGRMGGALTPAGHVVVEPQTPLSRLHLTLLQGLGLQIEQFGELGTSALSGV